MFSEISIAYHISNNEDIGLVLNSVKDVINLFFSLGIHLFVAVCLFYH